MGLVLHPHLRAGATHTYFQRFLPVPNSPNSLPSLWQHMVNPAIRPQLGEGWRQGSRRETISLMPEAARLSV